MNSVPSALTSEEKRILHNPQPGEASEFYWAGKNGEIERVKKLLKTISYQDLNRLEPNGSTSLHAASYAGHVEIVHILLHEYGCRRDCSNRYGLTAYEEASSDEIRQCFHRPEEQNRFCNDEQNVNFASLLNISAYTHDEEENNMLVDEEFLNNKWLEGQASSEEIEKAKREVGVGKNVAQSTFLRIIVSKLSDERLTETWAATEIRKILLQEVTMEHRAYEKCMCLVTKAFQEHKIEYLLRLYTLETPFYRALVNNVNALSIPVFTALDKLKARHFQGTSYRGVTMSDDDLRAYRWALKKNGAIRTITFCSTSLNRAVAERFATMPGRNNEKQNILIIFEFPTVCDTAINLGKLSKDLSCISEYENEAEIIVLPWTLFIIKQIVTNNNYLIIHLENIPAKKRSIISVLKDYSLYGKEGYASSQYYKKNS